MQETLEMRIVTITHKGRMHFCPIWFASEDNTPIARGVPNFVLDAAIEVQQAMNWAMYFINPEATGFAFRLEEIEPFEMEI